MSKHFKRRLISILLILITGSLYAFSNHNRVLNGYFDNSTWIFIGDTSWLLFFGVVSGTLIAELIKITK